MKKEHACEQKQRPRLKKYMILKKKSTMYWAVYIYNPKLPGFL